MRLKTLLFSILFFSVVFSFANRVPANNTIISVEKLYSSIVFTQADSAQVVLPCQSVASIVQYGQFSNTITVYYVNNADYEKSLAFNYVTCGFASKQATIDSLVAWSICDTSSGGGGQTLAISNDTLSISGGNSVVLPTSGGGGASLDALTSAVDTNTLNNGTNAQTWNWNNLPASGVGLQLNHVGTNTLGNLITTQASTLKVTMSGAHTGFNHFTSAGYFSNTSTGSGARNYAIYAEASGSSDGNYGVVSSGGIWERTGRYWFGSTPLGYIRNDASECSIYPHTDNRGLIVRSRSTLQSFTVTYANSSDIGVAFGVQSTTKQTLVFGGDIYRSFTNTAAVIERDADALKFGANTGTGGGYNPFTPNWIMTVYGTNSNVGIGTVTPNASAKLEVTTTTQMPVMLTPMTATQASAITPQNGGMVYVSDTNGTFTSVGFWGYENGAWVKL